MMRKNFMRRHFARFVVRYWRMKFYVLFQAHFKSIRYDF